MIDLRPKDIRPTKFACSPSDAMQLKIDALGTVDRLAPFVMANPELRSRREVKHFSSATEVRDYKQVLDTPVYFFGKETSSLIERASQSYPLKEEQAISRREVETRRQSGEDLPPPSYWPRLARAFAVFETPTLYITAENHTAPLSAIAWLCAWSVRHQELWLCIRGLGWDGRVSTPVWWSDGGSVGMFDSTPFANDDSFQAERIAIIKWICAASMFVEQEIVTADPVPVQRAFRKRAQAIGIADSNCHVVRLRHEIHGHREQADGAGSVEWTHRWIVRGHWRRQWFPSRSSHAPVWIHPHIKGPEDKPLAEPKPTVFAVVR